MQRKGAIDRGKGSLRSDEFCEGCRVDEDDAGKVDAHRSCSGKHSGVERPLERRRFVGVETAGEPKDGAFARFCLRCWD